MGRRGSNISLTFYLYTCTTFYSTPSMNFQIFFLILCPTTKRSFFKKWETSRAGHSKRQQGNASLTSSNRVGMCWPTFLNIHADRIYAVLPSMPWWKLARKKCLKNNALTRARSKQHTDVLGKIHVSMVLL